MIFLADFFNEGDPVQFEAVPQEGNADNPANSYCPWFATLVWKGKRPSVESSLSDSPYSTVTAANSQAAQQVIFTSFPNKLNKKLSVSCNSPALRHSLITPSLLHQGLVTHPQAQKMERSLYHF